MKVHIVNSFTVDGKGGNAAGVVICDCFPSGRAMQEIARIAGFSETVFVCPREEGYINRFFTPDCEVDLCGHATIAAFFLLGELGLIEGEAGEVRVNQLTHAGQFDVYILFKEGSPQKVFMEQAQPRKLGEIKGDVLRELCIILGIDESSVGLKAGLDLLPEIISTGLPDIIFPVISKDVLLSIVPDYYRLARLSEELGVISIHVFTLETILPSSTVHCRNFGPVVGINEESATGTANGALGYYLYSKGMLRNGELISEQGYCMGKPSLIHVKVGGESVRVGGAAVKVGEIEIDAIQA